MVSIYSTGMHKKAHLYVILPLLSLLFGAGEIVAGEASQHEFFGNWEPYSRMLVGVNGNMTLTSNSVAFARQGKSDYTILRATKQELVIKLDSRFGDDRVIRIGPIVELASSETEKIEVAFYATEAGALALRKTPQDNCSCWGLYYRLIAGADRSRSTSSKP
jgi:hypothetical protein